MKPNRRLVAVAGAAIVLLGAGAAWGAPPAKLKSVTLAIRHRVFHEFADQQEVRLNRDFSIGDTDFTGRLVQYVPDFAMNLQTGKVVSRTPEPRNPAFKILVSQKGAPQDTTWAMMSLPPHFARKSFLAFKVMRIDFEGRPPIVADSLEAVKELEALKEAARKSARPTEAEPSLPKGHPVIPPGGGSKIPMTPTHGSGSTKPSGTQTK